MLNKKYWPHQIRLTLNDTDIKVDELLTWCYDNILKGKFTSFTSYNSIIIGFAEETDVIVFKLRWCL